MINNESSLMLKNQKAKVKLREYEVPEKKWPLFLLNYKDLAFPTVLAISQCAEAINDDLDTKIDLNKLRFCSEFYDAAFQSREQVIHDADFALSGAVAYFFLGNYGSSKVLWQKSDSTQIIDDAQKCLFEVLSLVFIGQTEGNDKFDVIRAIKQFWENGNDNSLLHSIAKYREHIFGTNSPQTWFWGEVVCAVARIIGTSSARILLPKYSSLDSSIWEKYFSRKTAINLIWPSQRLLGDAKLLQGESGILQLPTGVGKTKSIELLIWSMFLAGRGRKALIVVPLRSLCNEISFDMRKSFSEDVTINQFSDVLENDFIDILLGCEKQILVCTPEKLQYIFHHDETLFGSINLFIFDESHMFDDSSRGTMYELLLTDIKLKRRENQQLILMSAVLPNAVQIVKWLFGEKGILAYDSNIKSTLKSVGFADNSKKLHYYTSVDDVEDYFVPFSYRTYKLKRLRKERKELFFPRDKNDLALYYANILCKTGGVAIYFPQKRSIPKLFVRIKDLDARGYSLERLKNRSDVDELLKFRLLYKEYYGEDYIYTQTVENGILPHYSALPNGIKISTEYSYKKNKVKAVACTSTLAQGVNIPIRYLIITGISTISNHMSVRNFQNLIGRAGRPGVFTEGDIIVTDSKLYDERARGRGCYRWEKTRNLFNATAVEACGSSILNMVRDFSITYNVKIFGSEVVEFICAHITDSNWPQKFTDEFLQKIKEKVKPCNLNTIRQGILERASNYREYISIIENEIIYLFLNYYPMSETLKQLHSIKNSLLENTLAYYLANEEEKNLLMQIFDSIELKIIDHGGIKNFSGFMVSTTDANKIKDWIANNNINTEKLVFKELIESIERLFREIYPSCDLPEDLTLAWLLGDSYAQISDELGLKIERVEKICQEGMSFKMSFLVGNIIDLIDHDCVNIDELLLLQKELRYGVNCKTAVSICEKVFNDRFLAKEIACIIGNEGISCDDIITSIKARKEKILALVSRYPSYFESVIQNI